MACWPLTFGIFSVKNDAIHYFLPYRYNISEALRNGEMPFWSPYIYQGYPIYGDMQSGAWNPIVWLFSLFGRYNLTLFHWENLLYIFLAGVGMYKLAHRYANHGQTALLAGAAYMLSGFMLSGQLINWLAAGAFIPFVLLYYLRASSGRRFGDAIKTGISLYLLFVAGYPSFFILTFYVLAGIGCVRLYDMLRGRGILPKYFFINHLIILVVFTGLAIPAIVSYIDLLPYYDRGAGTTFAGALHNSWSLQHLISMFFPSAIHATDLSTSTDVTCRNIYTGIFLLAVLFAFPPAFNRRNTLLLLLVILAFLFALGDATPVRWLAYKYIPLMDSFRHPSQARLFVIIGLILLAVPGIKRLLDTVSGKQNNVLFFRSGIMTAGVLVVTLIAAMSSTLLKSMSSPGSMSQAGRFKSMLDSMTLHDTVAVNGIIQLVFLAFFLWWIKKRNHRPGMLAAAWIINLVVMAQFVLPLTFVSQTPPREINNVIHSYPEGFPETGLDHSLEENSRDIPVYFEKMGSILFYNKKPGISKLTNSPAFLTQMDTLLADNKLYRYVAAQPMAYMATVTVSDKDSLPSTNTTCKYAVTSNKLFSSGPCDNNAEVTITRLGTNWIHVRTESRTNGMLVLSQNFHPYWRALIQKEYVPVLRVNGNFIGVKTGPGTNFVMFRFHPPQMFTVLCIQLITILLLLIISVISFRRTRKTKQVNR